MREIFLNKGAIALVDDSDYDELSKFQWHISDDGYASRTGPRPQLLKYRMHRVIMGCVHGDKKQVDHIDGNKLNNQRCNLRIATHSENERNRGKNKNNKSGHKGVSWHKKSNKWQVHVMANRKSIYLGLFENIHDASLAYENAAKKLHGDFFYRG